ncbi:MAG: translation initiation factor IF-2 [Phycisphaerae bacterium]|nr:translation initiation factor IF-2 [Phycisphaerae bacterium]
MATKTLKKVRITQIAKDIGISAKDIIEKCAREGVEGVTTAQATVTLGLAETIKEWFGGGATSSATETSEHVDVSALREKAKRAAPKKRKKVEDPDSTAAAAGGGVEPTAASAPTAPASPSKRTSVAAAPAVGPAASAATTRAPVAGAPAQAAPKTVSAKVPPTGPNVGQLGTPLGARPSPPPAGGGGGSAAPTLPRVTAPPPRPPAPPKPIVPAPMNVPTRPVRPRNLGEQLQQPAKTALSGPKVIRVEQADQVSTPRPRSPFGPSRPPFGRSPMGGGGAGIVRPGGPPGPGGAGAGGAGTRRPADSGRSGRAGSGQRDKFRDLDLKEKKRQMEGADGYFKRHSAPRRPTGPAPTRTVAKPQGPIRVPDPVSVKELSEISGVKVAEIMKHFLLAGNPITINAALDGEQAMEVMMDFGVEVEIDRMKTASEEIVERFADRQRTDERVRPPVVTILGHVDHGKTTLLDRIRSTNVAAGEAGGITQSTRAFQVHVNAGGQKRPITFIDTPGHEAFTAMRARGARVTDIVVLVVDAVDGIMPQTVESINHARAAKVAMIVALNKIDRPEFSEQGLQKVYGQMTANELNPVPWGGSVEVAQVSGLKGTGVDDLLALIALQADVLELKADWGGHAQGTVLEARMEEGRGAVAQLLVQEGTLKRGDFVVVGRAFGRVRDIVDDHGKRTQSAHPTTPVAISGIDTLPDAGDKFYVVDSLAAAEQAALERRALERERELSAPKVTLDNIFETMAKSKRKELPLVVKADVQGSVETLKAVLGKIKADDVTISIKHAAVGGINESDVELASTTGAVVVGFNVTSTGKARQLAEVRKVDLRLYDIIYQLTEDMDKAVRGLLEPEVRLQVLGHAEVRAVFKISKVGAVAGCYVTDGTIERNAQIRVTRDGIVIEKDRRLEQLKRFKDDAKEVRSGNECGMKINGYDDIREGDILECYRTTMVRPLGGGNA